MIRLQVGFLVGSLLVTSLVAAESPERRKFTELCATCHGNRGQGRVDLKTPSIAALPYWYVEPQLSKFRKSIRGTNPKDLHGMQMHAVAQTLDPKLLKGLAQLISDLPRNPTLNTLKGNQERGEEVFRDVCMQCHRFNASGEKVFGSPPLYGLQDWYIERQLRNFRNRVRGGDERDLKGAKMHKMVNELSDDDLKGVASYIAVLAERYVPKSK